VRKLSLIILLFFACSLAHAQKDYCKDVKGKYDPFKKSTEYRSPSIGKTDVLFTRTLIEGQTLDKVIVSFNAGYSDYSKKELFLLLDNGEVIKSTEAVTDCKMLDVNTYFFIGIMDLSDTDKENLKNHKIIKVRIGIEERDVSDKNAIKLQGYLPCVYNEKNI
jgi:hypothetical protein